LLNNLGRETRPAGLMAGPDASSVVSMKILVKENQILPMRVGLELFRSAVNRPAPGGIFQKNTHQPVRYFT